MTSNLTAEDLRALSWLRKEVQRSIESAHKAIQRHLREALALRGADAAVVDPVVLRAARDHLHQATGALELAGQTEAALLVRAAEQAVHRMVLQPELATGDLALCIERAGFALSDYLDSMIQGKPASSLGLFQPYRALLAFTDTQRVHPADLWRHDWRWRVIAPEADPPSVPSDDSAPEAMERLTLRLMRAPDKATFVRMSDLCAALGAQAKGRRATLWRLAAAFFEAQAQGLIKPDVYVKRAASRLLAQVRQGLKPSEVSDQLARDLLFFCACASERPDGSAAPRLGAVRAAYALQPGDLPDYDSPSLGRTDPAWLALARKRLNSARDAWSAALAGEPVREGALAASFAVLQESLEKIFPRGQLLGQALMRAAQACSTSQPAPPALGMEVATAILLLEASIDDSESSPEGLAERVQRLAQRVDAACVNASQEEPDPWMAAVYRRVSDAQTLKSVAAELRSTLTEVERAVDTFIKDPQDTSALLPVDAHLVSLSGVLAVLNLDDATRALASMRDDVKVLALPGTDTPQRQRLFERLADNLGALGFSIDILAVQPELARSIFQFDEQARVLRSPPAPAAEPAAAVDELGPDAPLPVALPVLDSGEIPAALAASVTPPADGPAAAADVDIALPLLSQAIDEPSQTDDKAELLAVFFEESADVFAQARDALAQLDRRVRDVADDLSHMTAIRRSFHTLKGSSRMVGLLDFGEAAWACEQLYNARLAQSVAMTPPLRAFTQEALDYLQRWSETLAAGETASHEPQPVVAAAEALRLRDELLPIEAPRPPGVEGVAPQDADHIKVIGPLRVEIAMFNIFLNEADELARQLSTQLAEWAVEPTAAPGEAIEALAHSLAGSSAAVGHADLAALARALEYALNRSNESGRVSANEPTLYVRAAADIHRLLHQFAAGFLETPQADLVAALDQHQPQTAPVLEEPVGEPDASPVALSVEDRVTVPVAPLADLPVVSDALEERPSAPTSLADIPVLDGVLEPEDDIEAHDDVDLDLFGNFREEAEELLPRLQAHLREWQARPAEAQLGEACMRTLHTYKGAARLVGAMRQGELAHRLESELQALTQTPELQTSAVERLSWRVDLLETEFAGLCDRASAALAAQVSRAPVTPQAPSVLAESPPTTVAAPLSETGRFPSDLPVLNWAVPPVVLPGTPVVSAVPTAAWGTAEIDWSRFAGDETPLPQQTEVVPVSLGAVRVKASLLDRLVNQAGETSMARARLETDLGLFKSSLADLTENLERLRRQLREVEIQAETQISSRLESVKATSQSFDPLEMDRYTRVQELTRIMAESVNDVATVQRSLTRALQSGEDQVALQGRLLRAMQDELMRTRMVEFESLADRLYRVIRQCAKDTGKLVRMDIVGGAIELDRSVLERMTAPFEHLIRNCMVHGIEVPEARVAAGKDATGSVEITLVPEGNEVTITLRDDGAGLDLAALRERALARGLLSPDEPADDQQLAALIFAPGVSTAERVSELAGRGVGLDVVRSEVSALGGRIELSSTPGRGTSFRMVLPLTTAVTRVLMLRADQAVIAVPGNRVESVLSESAASVESAYRQGYLQIGDEQVPFFGLGSLLAGEPVGAIPSGPSSIVLARSAAQRVAVHVDEVVGEQEAVVKHLGPQLSRLPGLAGLTLLPSGRVTAIYNVVVLANHYGAHARRRVQALLDQLPPGGPLATPQPQTPQAPLVLVVDDSLTVRRVTQRLLQRQDYRVSLAKDGLEALERLAEEKPDVVLSDIEMPRMDGFDLVRRMRSHAEWMGLPVVMITSRIAQKHRDLAHELGVRHYLGKPYSEEELLSVVAAYTRRDRHRLAASADAL